MKINGGLFVRDDTPAENSYHFANFNFSSGDPHITFNGPYLRSGGSFGQQMFNNTPANTTIKNCEIESKNVTTLVAESGVSDISFRNNEVTISSVTPLEANGATVDVRGNEFDTDVSELITGVGGGYVRENTPTMMVNVTDLAEEEGNEAYNDGTSGPVGPYIYDGTDWVGYGPTSGSTI